MGRKPKKTWKEMTELERQKQLKKWLKEDFD